MAWCTQTGHLPQAHSNWWTDIKDTLAPWWLCPTKSLGHIAGGESLTLSKVELGHPEWFTLIMMSFCQRAGLCECGVVLLLVMHHQETDMLLCLLGVGAWKPRVMSRMMAPSVTCWGSEFSQQLPNHGLNPQLLEEERWVLLCLWCLFDSPSCWRVIHIIAGL